MRIKDLWQKKQNIVVKYIFIDIAYNATLALKVLGCHAQNDMIKESELCSKVIEIE